VAPAATSRRDVDVVVVGGGQAGLAAGYHLRRAGLAPGSGFVILDASDRAGGAWPRMWSSLRLFSPSEYSSLPGWMMPAWSADGGFPPARHVVDYLTRYEQRYDLPVVRPVTVTAVSTEDDDRTGRLLVDTDHGLWRARAVVSATGTWTRPFLPAYPGLTDFAGLQLHAADYHRPDRLTGQRVVVVGGGNSAAQILAEVSTVAETTWTTRRPPRFLADDVDGRVLFTVATERRRALEDGRPDPVGAAGLGDVVMVPPVRDARRRGVLVPRPMFARLTRDGIAWADGGRQGVDVIVWCTGFRPALRHLAPLHLRAADGRVPTSGTRAVADPRLHLLGYGSWTGPASATLIGVGRTARAAVDEVQAYLRG
jgi:putative flavoprotein involved in K+ transport